MGQGVVLYYKMNEFPGVAQLVARQLWELDAASSSLATPTILSKEADCFVAIGFFRITRQKVQLDIFEH